MRSLSSRNRSGGNAIEVDRIDAARVQTIYNGLNLADWDAASRPAKKPRRVSGDDRGQYSAREGARCVHQGSRGPSSSSFPRFPLASRRCAGAGLFRRTANPRSGFGPRQSCPFRRRSHESAPTSCSSRHFCSSLAQRRFLHAIIEAMASSLPVVATDVGGNAEAVEDGITGFLVPQKILAPFRQPSFGALRSIPGKGDGRSGKELVAERFTTEAMMNQIAGA